MTKNFITYIQNKKRAVSPVIATVLLIALVISAIGIIWALTSGLLGTGQTVELIPDEIGVADTDNDGSGDYIEISFRNIGNQEVEITDITIKRGNQALSSWQLLEDSYNLPGQQITFIELQTLAGSDEINNQHDVVLDLISGDRVIDIVDIDVPAVLFAVPVLYDAGSGFSDVDLAADGWTTYTYNMHGGGPGIYVDGDDVVFDTNDDLLFYLNNYDNKMANGVITADFKYGDNDAVGIAFRIVDALNYYWVGITEHHNSPDNTQNEDPSNFDGPIFDGAGQFEIHKIVDGVSTLIDSKVPTSFSMIPYDLSRTYSFRIGVSGDTFAFTAKTDSSGSYEEIFTVTDSQFTDSGYFGVFSLAAENSRLDNFKVTT